MPKKSVPRVRKPDKLDYALSAGYSFHIGTSPTKELVVIRVIKPDNEFFTDVWGLLADGALDVLDRAAGVADEHQKINRNKRSPGRL
jgi:hypothetical protein